MTKFYTNAIEYGNNILVRGYDRGRAFNEKIPYKPTLYLPSKREGAEWKDIRGAQLDPMPFESMRDAKDFLNDMKMSATSSCMVCLVSCMRI